MQVQYIGGSHVRELSVADLAALEIESEASMVWDKRDKNGSMDVSNEVAEVLLNHPALRNEFGVYVPPAIEQIADAEGVEPEELSRKALLAAAKEMDLHGLSSATKAEIADAITEEQNRRDELAAAQSSDNPTSLSVPAPGEG